MSMHREPSLVAPPRLAKAGGRELPHGGSCGLHFGVIQILASAIAGGNRHISPGSAIAMQPCTGVIGGSAHLADGSIPAWRARRSLPDLRWVDRSSTTLAVSLLLQASDPSAQSLYAHGTGVTFVDKSERFNRENDGLGSVDLEMECGSNIDLRFFSYLGRSTPSSLVGEPMAAPCSCWISSEPCSEPDEISVGNKDLGPVDTHKLTPRLLPHGDVLDAGSMVFDDPLKATARAAPFPPLARHQIRLDIEVLASRNLTVSMTSFSVLDQDADANTKRTSSMLVTHRLGLFPDEPSVVELPDDDGHIFEEPTGVDSKSSFVVSDGAIVRAESSWMKACYEARETWACGLLSNSLVPRVVAVPLGLLGFASASIKGSSRTPAFSTTLTVLLLTLGCPSLVPVTEASTLPEAPRPEPGASDLGSAGAAEAPAKHNALEDPQDDLEYGHEPPSPTWVMPGSPISSLEHEVVETERESLGSLRHGREPLDNGPVQGLEAVNAHMNQPLDQANLHRQFVVEGSTAEGHDGLSSMADGTASSGSRRLKEHAPLEDLLNFDSFRHRHSPHDTSDETGDDIFAKLRDAWEFDGGDVDSDGNHHRKLFAHVHTGLAHSHSPHGHSPHGHSPHFHAPHTHAPHTHRPHTHYPPPPSPAPPPPPSPKPPPSPPPPPPPPPPPCPEPPPPPSPPPSEAPGVQAYIKAPDAHDYDFFGHALALSGNTLAVGAHGEDSCASGVATTGASVENCFDAGAVYVYVRAGIAWSFQAYIKASNSETNDQFGTAVALSGDTLVVGAPGEDSCSSTATNNACDGAGAAYVYTRSGTTWSFQAYIKASNSGTNDQFGTAVALSSNTLVVGAPGENSCDSTNPTNSACASSGAVYVHTRTGSAWSSGVHVKAPNAAANDKFGFSVAISDTRLAIGAYGEGSSLTGVESSPATVLANHRPRTNLASHNTGAVYIYLLSGDLLSGGGFEPQAFVKAPYPGKHDKFGYSVALSGATLAVGSYQEKSCSTGVTTTASTDNGCSFSGATYTYEIRAGLWTLVAFIKAPNAESGDFFGRSVALSLDYLAIGADGESSCTNAVGLPAATGDGCGSAGAAYVYTSACQTGEFLPSSAGTTPTDCVQCAPGKVQPVALAGSMPCNDCPSGKFAALPGQTACEDCDMGTYAALQGQDQCTGCPAGKFGDIIGQIRGNLCRPCGEGTFASSSGSDECTSCPEGTFSGIGATTCTTCYTGFNCAGGHLRTCSAGARSTRSLRICTRAPAHAARTPIDTECGLQQRC